MSKGEGNIFHSFFYNCENCQGDITKIIETGTCRLLLLSCGTAVLCFFSFANRKPNMDKLGWLSWDEKSVNYHRKFLSGNVRRMWISEIICNTVL